jgi:DNA-binding HxlR family transcriptional regulator
MKHQDGPGRPEDICPVTRAMSLIGYKWAGLVVWQLMDGPKRHGELLRALPGISPKTLTDRLRELEGERVLERRVFAEVPPRVEYELTDRGRSLYEVYEAIVRWARADQAGTPVGPPPGDARAGAA